MTPKKATGIRERFFGLMFETSGDIELEIVLPHMTRWGASVHTLFMEYPIEVEWYNEERQLGDKQVIHPWTLNYTPKYPAKYIIERRHVK